LIVAGVKIDLLADVPGIVFQAVIVNPYRVDHLAVVEVLGLDAKTVASGDGVRTADNHSAEPRYQVSDVITTLKPEVLSCH
jgi:hypothetical protein